MLSIFDPVRGMGLGPVLLRMVFAFIAGMIVGLERSYQNKPAGFRTHILVCLGACIASMTGLYLYTVLKVPADPSRIGTQVITGLGFIGAGTIVVTHKRQVSGLTTAAGMWTCGIIGLAVGAGFFEGAIIACVLVLMAETVMNGVRSRIIAAPSFDLAVSYSARTDLDKVLRYCKDQKIRITGLQIFSNTHEEGTLYSAIIGLRPPTETDPDELAKTIESMDGIVSCSRT
ncbi:MAG: MgtC/SapB family protein [Solobacterium sp.]|nr:MgtC/SapB family protein [Solobacterium sp.]